jgi:hypothetical protein
VAGWKATREQKKTGDSLLAAAQKQTLAAQAQLKAGAVGQLDLVNTLLESNSASLAQLESESRYQRTVIALEDALQRPANFISAATNPPAPRAANPRTERAQP